MCRKPENAAARVAWGCDADTAAPWRKVPVCWTCDGDDKQCPTCKGTGHAPLFRCPGAMRDYWAARVISAYGFAQVGLLPVSGGTEEQAAVFMAALGFVAGLRSKLTAKGASDG